MTASYIEHGAKPPGSFLSTPCFLPIKRLRLRPLAGYYAAILHNFNINNFIISAHFINIPKKDDISPGYE